MLFQVTRTSAWHEEYKPHEKCIPITLTRVDRRKFRTPEEHDEKIGAIYGNWFSLGSNHRITEDGIARDMEKRQAWAIEINSLEELMNFKDEVGCELVITTSYIDGEFPQIEIYDDYRE